MCIKPTNDNDYFFKMDDMFPTVYSVVSTESTAEYKVRSTLTGIIATVVLLFGLVFHILAVLTTKKAGKLWKDSTERAVPYFLLNALLKIDFSAVVFFLIRGFTTPIHGWNPTLLCNFAVSTSLFFTTASGLTNVVMCFERCLALMTPFSYRKHATLFKAKVAVSICIGISIVFSILPFFGLSSYIYVQEGVIICVSPGDLAFDIDHMLVHTILFFIIGFTIVLALLICNLIVVYFIIRLNNAVSPLIVPNVPRIVTKSASDVEGSSSRGGAAASRDDADTRDEDDRQTEGGSETARAPVVVNQSKHDIHLASLFIGVSVIYTISWLPLYMERLLTTFQVERPEILFSLTIGLLTMNHVVNPVLFVFFKKKNQQALKLLLLRACCRCRPSFRDRVEETIKTEMLSYIP